MSLQSENSSYCVLIQCFCRLGFIGLFHKKENIVLTAKEKKYVRYQKASSICILIFRIFIISLIILQSFMNFDARDKNDGSNIDYEILKWGDVMYFATSNNLIHFISIMIVSLPVANWFLFNFNTSFDIHRM